MRSWLLTILTKYGILNVDPKVSAMNKYLPKSLKNPQGFTLVELMVAIAILAILSVAGLIIYTGAQKNARDARRREDVAAISTALETNKDTSSTSYLALADTQFASGSIPTDSSRPYCAEWDPDLTDVIAMSASDKTTWSGTPGDCPGTWLEVTSSQPAAASKSWTVCTLLENGTANVFCRSHAQ
jgi:prepilin-type N-terminal cleavage/methylation domain-containing protein